jgi:hypothetical protein
MTKPKKETVIGSLIRHVGFIKGDVTDLQKRVQYLEQIILNLPKPEPKKRSFWNRWTWL